MNKLTETLRTIISGDAIRYFVWYRRFFIFSFVLAILYISNGLLYGITINRTEELEAELLRCKARYNIRLEEFSNLCRYPNIIELLAKHNRSNLRTYGEPPLKLEEDDE